MECPVNTNEHRFLQYFQTDWVPAILQSLTAIIVALINSRSKRPNPPPPRRTNRRKKKSQRRRMRTRR